MAAGDVLPPKCLAGSLPGVQLFSIPLENRSCTNASVGLTQSGEGAVSLMGGTNGRECTI